MSDLLTYFASSALSCSIAIALVLALRTPLARNFGAAAAYAAWALVPFAALALLLPARSVVVVMHAATAPTAFVTALPQTSAGAPLPPATGFDVASAVLYLWIAGAIATWLLFVWQQRRFVRGLGRLQPLHGGVHRAQATHGCPVLLGIWRPRIVVPADFDTRYTAAQRALILAHERQHRARGDAAANALASVLRSVFWFNPLLHFAAPFFLADQELACDAAVIARFPHARRTYADALIETQLGGARTALACHWRAHNTLLERIDRLTLPPIAPARRRFGNLAVTSAVLAATLVAWAARPAHTEVRYAAMAAGESAHAPAVRAESPGGSGARTEASTERKFDPRPASTARAAVTDRAQPAPRQSPPATTSNRVLATATPASRADARPSDPPQPAPVASGARESTNGDATAAGSTATADHPPRAIESFRRDHPPAYPAAAVRTHLEGSVVLDVHVGANGQPLDARVAQLEPPTANEFASAGLAAVTHWRFEPAQRDGHAVDGHLAVPFNFALDGPGDYARAESHRAASYRSFGATGTASEAAAPDAVVYVRVRIEDDGRVSASSVDRVDPASAQGLGDAALAALKTWTFNPAFERDKAVASTAIVPVVFGANPQATPPIAHLRNLLDTVRVTPTRN